MSTALLIRAFIAVELSEAVRRAAAALQTTLRATGAEVAWVEPAHLHLTLKFLGNIEASQIQPLTEALTSTVRGHTPFSISLAGIGAFPSTRSPRVVWVGVRAGQEALVGLAQAVEQQCATLGFRPEARPFSAHLTIGRVRSRDRLAMLVKSLQMAESHGGPPALVDHLILFQSTLSPRGPTYTPLATIPLV